MFPGSICIGEFKAFWRPATVVRCFHPLFDVQFHTGEIGKRHMNELRTRSYISPSAKAASLRKRQSTAHSSSADAVSQQVPLVQTAEEQSSRLAATSAGAVFRLTWRPTCCCATHRGRGSPDRTERAAPPPPPAGADTPPDSKRPPPEDRRVASPVRLDYFIRFIRLDFIRLDLVSGSVVSGLFDVTSLSRPTAGGHVIRGRAGSLPGQSVAGHEPIKVML